MTHAGGPLILEISRMVTVLEEENKALQGKLQAVFNAPPAQMSSPLGLVTIDSTGMRAVIDAWNRERRENAQLRAALTDSVAAMEWAFHHLDRGDGCLEVTDTIENIVRAEAQRKAALAPLVKP